VKSAVYFASPTHRKSRALISPPQSHHLQSLKAQEGCYWQDRNQGPASPFVPSGVFYNKYTMVSANKYYATERAPVSRGGHLLVVDADVPPNDGMNGILVPPSCLPSSSPSNLK
jgi:hypothetical protein